MLHEEVEMLVNEIELENLDEPGQATRIDAGACRATRDALLRALPDLS